MRNRLMHAYFEIKTEIVGMKPPHPGDFVRTEILDALHLSVARAAEILGVRRATLSDLLHGKTCPVTGNGAAPRKSLRRVHGYAAADAGLV